MAGRAWSRGACGSALLAELGDAVGGDTGRLSTAASVREAHGKDESYHAAIGPDAVVFPASTEEVSQVRVFIRGPAVSMSTPEEQCCEQETFAVRDPPVDSRASNSRDKAPYYAQHEQSYLR